MKMASESEYLIVNVIPTGLPQLDRVIGVGGIPTKRITEISGQWSVGKTTLALQLVAQAQKAGVACVWYDAEFAWDDKYAKKLGVDTTKLGLLQNRYAEEALDEILEHAEENEDVLFIIDAVGALHPKDEAEKTSGERTIGGQSALVARFCRKIVPLLAVNNHALVVLNHEYTPIMNTGGRPTTKTSGGAKLEYHKSIWIRLQKAGQNIKEGEKITGFVVNAKIGKNKLADTQTQSCELELYFGRGFSAVSDAFQTALDAGEITKDKQTYVFRGENLGRGIEKAKKAFAELHA